MRNSYCLYLLLVIVIMFSGCIPKRSIVTPAPTETLTPFATFTPILPTSTLHPTPTTTLTPPVPLESEKAKDAIKTFLQEPSGCVAPCFWGIMPEQTTFGEAKNIFTYLGLQLTDDRAIVYDFDSGLSVSAILRIQRDWIVENINIYITPEKQKAGGSRMWSAYSPELLIKQYGLPSNVTFKADWGPRTFFAMDIYFDSVNLIVEYSGYGVVDQKLNICPLTFQFDSVQIWMGKNPVNPPSSGVLLEEATSMTIQEFSELMKGNPSEACFSLKKEMFP